MYKDKAGNTKKVKTWHFELRDHLGRVKIFAGFKDKGQTELLGKQIERLINYKVAGEPPDTQLSRWLEQIPERLSKRLVEIGLLDNKSAARCKPLTEHIEDFKLSLLAKGDTDLHVKQTKSALNRICEGCKFMYWSHISASQVQNFLAGLRYKGNPISARTFNFYLKAMKSFCHWMVQDRRAGESVLSHLCSVNTKTDRRRLRRSLEGKQNVC